MMLSHSPCYPCVQLDFLIDIEDGSITQHSGGLGYLNYGIEYYFVEVTSKSGIQYGICAQGTDAYELYQRTLAILSTQRLVDIVSRMYD